MTRFTTKDKELMQDAHDGHMMDDGVRWVYAITHNDYGENVITYTEGEETICGLELRQGDESQNSEMTVTRYEAVLRLPIDFTVNEKDRFQITKFRETAVNWMFQVNTPIQTGMTANRVGLIRIHT
jgi:hypothetical protein